MTGVFCAAIVDLFGAWKAFALVPCKPPKFALTIDTDPHFGWVDLTVVSFENRANRDVIQP